MVTRTLSILLALCFCRPATFGQSGVPEDLPADPARLADDIAKDLVIDSEIEKAVAEALKHQGDPAEKWDRAWGDVIEAAWKQRKLRRTAVTKYVRQSVLFRLAVRPVVVRGEPLPVALEMESRLGTGRVFGMVLRWKDAKVGDQPIGSLRNPGRDPVLWSVAHRGDPPPRFLRFIDLNLEDEWTPTKQFSPNARIRAEPANFRVQLPDGVYLVTLTISCDLSLERVDQFAGTRPEVFVSFEQTMQSKTTVVPEDHPSSAVAQLCNDNDRELVQDRVSISKMEIQPLGEETQVSGTFSVIHLPMPVAFDVFLRSGEREWYLMSKAATPQDTSMYGGFGGTLYNFDSDLKQADVILRPSARVARTTVDVTEIWGEEVILKDVPIAQAP